MEGEFSKEEGNQVKDWLVRREEEEIKAGTTSSNNEGFVRVPSVCSLVLVFARRELAATIRYTVCLGPYASLWAIHDKVWYDQMNKTRH